MKKPVPDKKTLTKLYLHERLTLEQIGLKYGFSSVTVGKWLKLYEIPARPAHPVFQIRKVNGKYYKLCRGSSHETPQWLLLKDFTKRRDGYPRSQCRACESRRKNSMPLVPLTLFYRGKLESIVNRLGVMETSRRLGISQAALWKLRHPTERTHMKHRTATRILLLLRELNDSQEVRHRDSIHYGSYIRGKEEKVVENRRDLYKRSGDERKDFNT